MYKTPHFNTGTLQQVTDFVHRYPFATLVGHTGEGYPVATHVPLLLQQDGEQSYLLGHIMKHTDHHKAFVQNNKVLAIFNGPNAYISATWYSNPQQASTWNYMTVHAKGELTFLNEDALLAILEKTTAHFENDSSSPALVSRMPEAYVHKLMKAIIAFRIDVTSLEHVFKLSQNKDEETQESIIEQLLKRDNESMAVAMEMKKWLMEKQRMQP